MTQPNPTYEMMMQVLVVTLLLFGSAVTASAQQDTTPPVLLDMRFTPTAIDTTSASQNVTVTVRLTDDLSGFAYGYVNFCSPSGQQCRYKYFSVGELISGDAMDGTYRVEVTFPQYIEAGTWHVNYVLGRDIIGNSHYDYEQDLLNLGFATTLDVTSVQDTTPPGLHGLIYSPASIDVSNGAQNVTVTVRLTDDLSGFAYGYVNFCSPSGQQCRYKYFSVGELISGDAMDGTYRVEVTFPQYIEAGTWHVNYVLGRDIIGNSHYDYEQDLLNLGLSTSLDITSVPADTTPPVVLSLRFTPKAVNSTNSSQDVTVTVRLTEDLSGFANGYVNFCSPSGQQCRYKYFSVGELVSGDGLDGTYRTTVTIPQFSELGIWHVNYVLGRDIIGNSRYFYEQELIDLGFPTTLLNTTDQPPVANAGADQLVEIGLMATLNGSGSYDPEAAGPLTYEWRDSNGSVLGTTASINVAAAFGTKTYTLTVTDVVGLIASDTVDVTGRDTTPPVVIVLKPNGGEKLFVNSPYIIQWSAADLGVISFFDVFYSLNGGSTYLPVPGCSSLNGLLRSCAWNAPGTATTKGRIRVMATDASSNVGSDISNANFNIVSGAGTITVTAPNTVVDWGIGSTLRIAWTHNLGTNTYVRIEVSRDARETWQEIAASVKNTSASGGSYDWHVTGPVSAAARIRVSGVDIPVGDISNVDFTISEPYISVVGPSATAVNFGYGTTRTQTWTTNLGALDKVDVLLSTDGGATCSVSLGSNIVASNKTITYTVPVLGLATATARICVRWTSNPAVVGLNPVNFHAEPAYIKVTYPNLAADALTIGGSPTITWASNLGPSENVMVELSLDGGNSYNIVLLASTPSDGTQAIVVPGPAAAAAKIRITWLKNNVVKDDSSESFPIN